MQMKAHVFMVNYYSPCVVPQNRICLLRLILIYCARCCFCSQSFCDESVNARLCFCVPACNCNGKSGECYFDAELYRATGHGGHCRNCADNTDGPNCERCLDNYYRDQSGSRCLPCSCNSIGESVLPELYRSLSESNVWKVNVSV